MKKLYLIVKKNGDFYYFISNDIPDKILNNLDNIYIKCLDNDNIIVDRLYKK